jgi:uncharacterized membrane protein
MNYYSKLRWSIGLYYPVVIFSSYIIAILELMLRRQLIRQGMDISSHPYITYTFVGSFFILMGIIQWFKYRLWQYPVLGLIVGVLCFLQAANFYDHPEPFFIALYAITFIILVLFIIINWKVLYSQERFEINSRRLFRLAAEMIKETGNGFTERPFSAGKIEFTREELQEFARFINGKYVARSFHYADKTVFAFSMNKSLVRLEDPKDVSHVVFEQNGNITVYIAAKDYSEYVARFNFDRLCGSLADVFSRFLGYYRQGLESRIITELKTAR